MIELTEQQSVQILIDIVGSMQYIFCVSHEYSFDDDNVEWWNSIDVLSKKLQIPLKLKTNDWGNSSEKETDQYLENLKQYLLERKSDIVN